MSPKCLFLFFDRGVTSAVCQRKKKSFYSTRQLNAGSDSLGGSQSFINRDHISVRRSLPTSRVSAEQSRDLPVRRPLFTLTPAAVRELVQQPEQKLVFKAGQELFRRFQRPRLDRCAAKTKTTGVSHDL